MHASKPYLSKFLGGSRELNGGSLNSNEMHCIANYPAGTVFHFGCDWVVGLPKGGIGWVP
ncbi:uncharacterized protein N7496_000710 [Penicillium cataractarum]|uniref:Uncharacterized protein n=1 Tax=Penicillium cataractarum TaxID=2100454 RepID=A0A9W9VUK7_9EURO|nr:uncharacterized protein N7496_000710 [Penicillium cataractarum]KAJ5389642.1 hypothetical protein N7496_000710 [Penicillium cataractarum]